MILPVRCFTCNRLIADEKLSFFEKHRYLSYQKVKEIFKESVRKAEESLPSGSNNEIVLYPNELKQEYLYPNENFFTVSPTTDFLLLNLLGVENYCCRRMYLGLVNLIDKIN
jgi:DNA-directed RNA polymerase subunit N (RpoN/RPB10)